MHNKKEDVQKNKQEILQLLEEEIALRYYYQAGRIEAMFDHDKEILKALTPMLVAIYKAGSV